jgi:signal transduction histidine kinase
MNESVTASSTSASDAELGRSAAESVLVEQVKLLYANLRVSQAVALVNGIVLALVQSAIIEAPQVMGWLACLVLVTLGRGVLGLLFARSAASVGNILRWRAYFLAGVVASALVWGSTALLLYPPGSVVHQVFITFVLGGMVAGAITLLTPVFQAFVLFAIGALVPIIVRFVFALDDIHYAMAGMSAVFLFAMLVIGKRIHATIDQSLRLRFENRDLIAYLTSEKAHVESINAALLATQEDLRRSNEALESRVAERTEALQELDRRKDEFLAMLSHELRNPLAPIRNSVYILNQVEPLSPQARHAVDVIERQTQHVTRLVDDLLDVTRIARGKIELRRETVNLTDLVSRTVEDHSSIFKRLGLDLTTNLPAAAVYANVDPTRMAQVIGNLLHNAVKFTPEAGQATVTLRVVDQCAEIRMSDTGAGISPELFPVLFQPFIQGEQTLARTEGGIGLGLALVKGIVELHGGTVQVESAGRNKGSTFIVRLPLVPAHVGHEEPGAFVHGKTPSRRVLVVDDNDDAADSLAQLVEMFGHTAEVAYDGTSAIAKAHAVSPDVVLCDLGLPGMSGYEVARALRAERSDIRLIAVSGYAQPEDITKATSAGFDGHIAKPPNPETVRRLLLQVDNPSA